MNERQRTEYLEAMGIQVFVPRWILPAAAPSRQAPLPQPDVSASPELSPEARSSASQPEGPASSSAQRLGGVVSGIIGELAGQTKSARVQTEASPQQSPAKRVLDALDEKPAADESVQFSLSLWRVSDSLLVIDSHQARQALPTGTLLSNILFAKGLCEPLPKPEVLAWPIGGSEGGWPQACEMVQAFLQARFERQPVQSLWLMGEDAYRAVFSGDNDYQEQLGHLRDLMGLGCLATVLPSLADMLKTPSLKIPAWQAIKAQKIG